MELKEKLRQILKERYGMENDAEIIKEIRSMKKVFRLITRVEEMPDVRPDLDRTHGTITGCQMASLT